MLGITTNVCKEEWKSRERDRHDDIDSAAHTTGDPAIAEPSQAEQALAELSEEDRTLLHLKELHGWTFKEIAEHFGVPESTVKDRHKRAVKSLSKRYNQRTKKDNERDG